MREVEKDGTCPGNTFCETQFLFTKKFIQNFGCKPSSEEIMKYLSAYSVYADPSSRAV